MSSAPETPASDRDPSDRDLVRRILLLAAAAFAASGSARIADPLLPQLAADFAISTGVAAQAVSSFALAYGIAQLFFGPLGDRLGKYRVISFAMLASIVGSVFVALAPNFSTLVVFRAVTGATAAAAIPLAMAWIADNVPYEKRQPVLAGFLSGQILGITAGQIFGGLFADLTGWRGALWATVGAFALVAFLLLREVRRSPDIDAAATADTTTPFMTRFKVILSRPWPRLILTGVCIEGACVFGGLAFVPAYLHERFGISLTKAGLAMALFGAGGLCYSLFARHFVNKLGQIGLAIAGGLTLSLAFAIFIFAPSWGWAPLGAWCLGLGYYMIHNTFQTNATQMVPEYRGTAVSVFASLFFFGQSGGVALNSVLVGRLGYPVVFAISAIVLPLIGFVFAALLKRRAGLPH